MRKSGWIVPTITLLAAFLGIVTFQNCGSKGGGGGSSSGGGPVDGNYRMTTYTCGPRDILAYYGSDGITSVLFNINNTGGTQTFVLNTGCQASTPLTLSYVDSSHLTSLNSGGISCSGNCGSSCVPQSTPSDTTPTFMSYTNNSGTLTLTNSVQPSDLGPGSDMSQVGCRVGDVVVTVLVRQ